MQTCKLEILSLYKYCLQGRHSHNTRIKQSRSNDALEKSILVGDGALGCTFSRARRDEWAIGFIGFYKGGD